MGREGQSGDFGAHLFAGAAYIFFGTLGLGLWLFRSRRLPYGRSFCEVHVPEKNKRLMKQVAWTVITISTLGIVLEGHGGCNYRWLRVFESCFYDDGHATHQIMYFTFACNALVLLLEVRGRLPPDSARAFLVLTLIICWVIWSGHAPMKATKTDARLHGLVGQATLAHAAIALYSVLNPSNIVAYLANWGMFVFEGTWFVTIGVNASLRRIPMDKIDPLFCFEAVLVAMFIVLIGTCFGPPVVFDDNCLETKPSSDSSNTSNEEYDKLQLSEEEDAEEMAGGSMA